MAGLFDVTTGDTEFIGKEIVKCIQLAEDGIHAVLIVLSLRNRFSIEEKEAVRYILKFFGSKITDYMIVLITGGDELEESDETMEDYLGIDCPEPLKVEHFNYPLVCILPPSYSYASCPI